ncbi:hypothetical protein F5B21DRAFT_79797 [Xylaria acuta]|nr:hypothetical protein F5B21DRAFT_79797 [Xylaria acuta]
MRTPRLIFDLAWVLATAASSLSPSEPEPEPEMHRCGIFDEVAEVATGGVQEHGVAATKDDMYAIGGIPPNDTFPIYYSRRDVSAYNFGGGAWRRVADFPIGITHANAAGVDGGIYVLGGLTDNGKDAFWNYTTACYVYRPETGKWDHLPPVPDHAARGAAAIGVHGTKIILAGGLRSVNFTVGGQGGIQESVKMVTSYDTRTGVWKTLRPLPEPRDHAGGAVFKSKFYVIGGRDHGLGNEKNQTWVLNLKKWGADWVPKADLPTPRAGFAVGTYHQKIMVFGGEGNKHDPTGVYSETEAYNTGNDQWKKLAPLLVPRHGMGAVSFRHYIWIAGGGVLGGRAKPDAHTTRFTLNELRKPPASFGPFNASHNPDGCLW